MMSDQFDSAGVAAPDPARGSACGAVGGLRRSVRSPLVPETAEGMTHGRSAKKPSRTVQVRQTHPPSGDHEQKIQADGRGWVSTRHLCGAGSQRHARPCTVSCRPARRSSNAHGLELRKTVRGKARGDTLKLKRC